jgi:serine/threonine protein kinase/Tol biopolymer transport system component
MSSDRDRWRRVKDVFDEVRALPEDRRSAHLAAACGSDQALWQEVESLLSSYATADDFLEQPAAQVFGGLSNARPLEGRVLGPYQIGSRVGAGGMGEVYKAHDTRLGRTVAIKVLPAHLATDPQGRKRFEREARAVAALNHPHISTLYDIGAQDGIDFLVMEFLDGETLAARLAKGALPLAKVLEYGVQIASALNSAHRAGIVHRDLKPGNIMLTGGGAKLLDFGLAKPRTAAAPVDEGSSRDLTGPGTVLGTVQYMAPEQIEGKEADARSDLFAFGVVLHEMLTGKRAFDAPSRARLAAAILTTQPPRVSELNPDIPVALDYVVGRCLAKDPDERWQTARDLLAELERGRASLAEPAASSQSAGVRANRVPRPSRALVIGVIAASIVALAAGAYTLSRPRPTGDVVWLSILPPPGGFDLSPDPTISPNGEYVVFEAQDTSYRTQIWLKRIGSPEARPIPGTEGTEFHVAAFWSPDSRSIGFFADGKLKRVDIDGTSLQVLAPAPEPRGGTWTSSGVIIFNADTQTLMQVPALGGTPSKLSDLSSGGVRLFPHALPDGDRYLFTSRNAGGQGMGVYVGSLSSGGIERISDAWSPAKYANGHLLFVRQQGLFAQPLDIDRRRLVGEPIQIADGVGIGCCTPLSFAFSASEKGLAYWGGSMGVRTQLTWYDRSGQVGGVAGEPGVNSGFSISQDGRRVALERLDRATSSYDIWTIDLQRGGDASRLTTDGSFSCPVLSPSGQRLALMERGRGIVTMAAGGGSTDVVVAGAATRWPYSWSPDGRLLTFIEGTPTVSRILTTTDRRDTSPTLYREAPFRLFEPEISPDGRWLAYGSNESGRHEVYVDTFPVASTRSRVSLNGGARPKWRSDGRELYFLAPDRQLMAVGVTLSEASGLSLGTPVPLFEGPEVPPDRARMQYFPSPGGSRFLFNARVEDRTPVGLTVVLNWPALLQK